MSLTGTKEAADLHPAWRSSVSAESDDHGGGGGGGGVCSLHRGSCYTKRNSQLQRGGDPQDKHDFTNRIFLLSVTDSANAGSNFNPRQRSPTP